MEAAVSTRQPSKICEFWKISAFLGSAGAGEETLRLLEQAALAEHNNSDRKTSFLPAQERKAVCIRKMALSFCCPANTELLPQTATSLGSLVSH